MSTLVFNGTTHKLTMYNAQGVQVGQWDANNVVDSSVTLRYVPNGSYPIIDQKEPHTHGKSHDDTVNGAYGTRGIIRLNPFKVDGQSHDGVGIHAGRADKGAFNHATHGCIRTTEDAMAGISTQMDTDPISSITVQNNHDQHNHAPHVNGDAHPHAKAHPHHAKKHKAKAAAARH